MENLFLYRDSPVTTVVPNGKCIAVLHLALSGLCILALASCSSESAPAVPAPSATATSPPSSSSTIRTSSPTIREVIPQYTSDLTDKRRLAGLADTIFVGTVSELTDTVVRYGKVNTQFKVKVLQPLKGSPGGDVVVEQEGGHDTAKNITYLVKGDQPIQVGSTYLLSATFRHPENVYSIIPVFGDTLLTAEETSDISAGKTPKSVLDMRDAIAHQIPS